MNVINKFTITVARIGPFTLIILAKNILSKGLKIALMINDIKQIFFICNPFNKEYWLPIKILPIQKAEKIRKRELFIWYLLLPIRFKKNGKVKNKINIIEVDIIKAFKRDSLKIFVIYTFLWSSLYFVNLGHAVSNIDWLIKVGIKNNFCVIAKIGTLSRDTNFATKIVSKLNWSTTNKFIKI